MNNIISHPRRDDCLGVRPVDDQLNRLLRVMVSQYGAFYTWLMISNAFNEAKKDRAA